MRRKKKNWPSSARARVPVPGSRSRLDDELNLAAGIRYRLGEMLLQTGRITHDKLDAAIAEQRNNGEKIGRILLRLGLDLGELDVALEFQQRQAATEPAFGLLRFGELMVATGLITREQMAASLARQKLTGKKLGEDLVAAGLVRPHQIAHTLQFQQKLVSAALATALTLGSLSAPSDAKAGSSSISAPIEATKVAKQASLKVLEHPAGLTITAEDISRGYVEVPTTLKAEIKYRSLGGYMLVFENHGDFVHQTLVSGLGDETRLDSKGGVVTQLSAAPHIRETTVAMGFRFMLADHARPGTYDWPMQMSVLPL